VTRRGGVLLDLFLILLILALLGGGVAAFFLWQRGGGLSKFVRRAVAAAPAVPAVSVPLPGTGGEAPQTPDIDVSDRAAWIQGRFRDLLSKQGLAERHVIKAYNEQRQEGGIQWLEATLEARRPARFDDKKFLAALAPALAEKRLSVMEDARVEGRWTLAVGDRKRIYQRLVMEH
jgi:hypothetical protein